MVLSITCVDLYILVLSPLAKIFFFNCANCTTPQDHISLREKGGLFHIKMKCRFPINRQNSTFHKVK